MRQKLLCPMPYFETRGEIRGNPEPAPRSVPHAKAPGEVLNKTLKAP